MMNAARRIGLVPSPPSHSGHDMMRASRCVYWARCTGQRCTDPVNVVFSGKGGQMQVELRMTVTPPGWRTMSHHGDGCNSKHRVQIWDAQHGGTDGKVWNGVRHEVSHGSWCLTTRYHSRGFPTKTDIHSPSWGTWTPYPVHWDCYGHSKATAASWVTQDFHNQIKSLWWIQSSWKYNVGTWSCTICAGSDGYLYRYHIT